LGRGWESIWNLNSHKCDFQAFGGITACLICLIVIWEHLELEIFQLFVFFGRVFFHKKCGLAVVPWANFRITLSILWQKCCLKTKKYTCNLFVEGLGCKRFEKLSMQGSCVITNYTNLDFS
jgi:hypothetical protein